MSRPRIIVWATLDGFAIRLIRLFPKRSGHDPAVLELASPKNDYPAIRDAAVAMVAAGHLSDVLPATYAGLFVDEYQDCSLVQHALTVAAAEFLPTCVLGDPMQAIFGFKGNPLVDWEEDVHAAFGRCGELATQTARKTGIHNMAKSGGRKRRPQGCSLRSHRLRRLKPLTPTLSPATHSAMPSMLPCCTSDLKRRSKSCRPSAAARSQSAVAASARSPCPCHWV